VRLSFRSPRSRRQKPIGTEIMEEYGKQMPELLAEKDKVKAAKTLAE
jgi:hypothetical protein